MMNSLKAYINKEIMEGIRTNRFLILAAGIVFFAFADPLMLKLLPDILKNQAGGIDISSMIQINQTAAVNNYLKDLYQIITLITSLTLMGLVSAEKKEKTLTIPVSMGCKASGIIFSKMIVYSLFIMIAILCGVLMNYYYSGVLFGNDAVTFQAIIKAGFLYGVYFVFLISLLLITGSFAKKSFVAALITMAIAYFMPVMQNLFDSLNKALPSNLLAEAGSLKDTSEAGIVLTLMVTAILIAVFAKVSVYKLKKDELV